MPNACPSCSRPNAEHRLECLYCGTEIPAGGSGPSTAVVLPENLDALVRRAMSGGGTAALEEALREAKVVDVPPVVKPAQDEPSVANEAPVDIEASLGALSAKLDEARQACGSQEPEAIAVRLSQIRDGLEVLLRDLPAGSPGEVAPSVVDPAPEEPIVRLPRVRRPHSLIVDSLGGEDAAPALATALDVDVVTARLIAVSRSPKVALRGNDRDAIEARAQAVRSGCSVRAVVVDDAMLRSFGPSEVMLRGHEEGIETALVLDWASEEMRPDESAVSMRSLDELFLVVPGEIVIERFRVAKGGGRLRHLRESQVNAVGEQRLSVMDLHLPDQIVRVFERVTHLDGMPGSKGQSFRQSMRGWLDELQANPAVRVLEPKSCKASLEHGRTGAGENRGGTDTGWASWEEHSRGARALMRHSEPAG